MKHASLSSCILHEPSSAVNISQTCWLAVLHLEMPGCHIWREKCDYPPQCQLVPLDSKKRCDIQDVWDKEVWEIYAWAQLEQMHRSMCVPACYCIRQPETVVDSHVSIYSISTIRFGAWWAKETDKECKSLDGEQFLNNKALWRWPKWPNKSLKLKCNNQVKAFYPLLHTFNKL